MMQIKASPLSSSRRSACLKSSSISVGSVKAFQRRIVSANVAQISRPAPEGDAFAQLVALNKNQAVNKPQKVSTDAVSPIGVNWRVGLSIQIAIVLILILILIFQITLPC